MKPLVILASLAREGVFDTRNADEANRIEEDLKEVAMTSDDFVVELAGLADQPDAQSISNNDAVRHANILAASPKTREEGIARLATLSAEYPMSGNICALYTQAMAWDGRIEDALTFAREKLPQVSNKSDLAMVAGIVCLQTSRLRDATLWFLRAIAAQGKTASDEHLLLELLLGHLVQCRTQVLLEAYLQVSRCMVVFPRFLIE